MTINNHSVDVFRESKLHYMKKIKGEILETIDEKLGCNRGAKGEVLVDLIRFLDNQIFTLEDYLSKEKNREREDYLSKEKNRERERNKEMDKKSKWEL